MALMAFNGKAYAKEVITQKVGEMTQNLRWLLIDQYKVSPLDAAGLADEGFTTEAVWRHLGDNREEVLQSCTDTLSLPGDTKERRMLRIQVLTVWTACKSAVEATDKRHAHASAMGVSMPMDLAKTKVTIDKAIASMPGRHIETDDRPSS